MSSVPGRSRSTDTVLARYAQRVSNGIVLDIGVERGRKKSPGAHHSVVTESSLTGVDPCGGHYPFLAGRADVHVPRD